MLGSRGTVSPPLARTRRAARARADLRRARGLAEDPPSPYGPATASPPRAYPGPPAGWPRLAAHASLLALITLILAGELLGAWSAAVIASPVDGEPALQPQPQAALGPGLSGPLVLAPLRLSGSAPLPVTPPLQRPRVVVGAFQAYHPLADGETLGLVAERYGVSLEALVWSNDLDWGDALTFGQILRIPRVTGLAYTVGEDETLASIAARFGVGPEAIAAFGPNRIGDDLQLQPGVELFIPGGTRAVAESWLSSVGGPEGLAGRGPEPAGIVREGQTNLRTGPSTEHPRVLQLDAGRKLGLRARHGDWLQVELGGTQGWIRQDMLEVPPAWVVALPETADFPAPPPRWVWPARGSISSRFGPRWGGFHNGLDIANRAWTPILAARAGTVSEAGWCSGYGYCVKLRHGGGVETVYGHLIDRPPVRRGEQVAAGELIGHMGSTYDRAGGGYSTGVHLHFTVFVNGRAVDPLRFLP